MLDLITTHEGEKDLSKYTLSVYVQMLYYLVTFFIIMQYESNYDIVFLASITCISYLSLENPFLQKIMIDIYLNQPLAYTFFDIFMYLVY